MDMRTVQNNKIKMIFVLIIMILTVLASAGCMENKQSESKSDPYGEDGMLGISNTNPNLRTNPTHYNYDDDVRLISEAIAPIDKVLDSRVTINGGEAYVKIRLPENIPLEEAEWIENVVYRTLTFQMPRYEIFVTSNINASEIFREWDTQQYTD